MPKLFSESIQVIDFHRHPFRIVAPLTLLLFLSGGSLYYWRSTSVRLTADGATRRIFTKAHTLREFIEEQHIPLGPSDFMTPAPDTLIGHNTAVKITRVTTEIRAETATGAPVLRWQSRTRQNLRRVLVQRGYAEARRRKIQLTKHDGIVISQALLLETKSREPIYALTIFNRRGLPEKKFDLLKCRMLKVRSTGYYVGEKTVPSDTTFLGHKLQRGLVAVDPAVIPLGTRLYVEGYGYAFASDTGSAIKGLRLDLAVKDKYEEARYNRYDVPVYILEKNRHW